MTQHFVLLEGDAEWAGDPAVLIHWDRSDVAPGRLALPQLVDHNWRKLRDDYLGWIHDCGELPVDGGTLRTTMRLGKDGISAWWMTLMAEKSPMKTRTIYTVLKLRALEILCDIEQAEAVSYVGGDARIDGTLKRWCAETGRTYRHIATARPSSDNILGRRVAFLPHGMRGLAWLLWTWWSRIRPVRSASQTSQTEKPDGAPDCTVVTYFPNCDMANLEKGQFRSNYWQEAHDLFDRMKSGIDWIWIYAPSNNVSLKAALDYRDKCNAANTRQRFYLLEEFVTPAIFLKALGNWFSLALRSRHLMRTIGARRLPGSRMNLVAILKEDWAASLRGIVAAEAAYYQAAFSAMAGQQPVPATGLYVFENQPWEAALTAAWKQRGVPRVVAHQHEAIKPLNLRLFDDRRTLAQTGEAAKPLPDLLAIGSLAARDGFVKAGWAPDRAILIESLRFRSDAPVTPEPGQATGPERYLLLVTGYLAPETRTMLAMTAAADATGALNGYAGIRIKPHPFLPVDEILRALKFESPVEIVTEALEALWPTTGFAFVANSTAAIFDALAARIPAAVCAPSDDLNLSPALGMEGVVMIASADTLAVAAQDRMMPADAPEFCYNTGLPKWSALLGLGAEEITDPPKAARGMGG